MAGEGFPAVRAAAEMRPRQARRRILVTGMVARHTRSFGTGGRRVASATRSVAAISIHHREQIGSRARHGWPWPLAVVVKVRREKNTFVRSEQETDDVEAKEASFPHPPAQRKYHGRQKGLDYR